VGTDAARILAEAEGFLGAEVLDAEDSPPRNPYGDGRAGERIADIVRSVLLDVPRETVDWDGA
jgi:UDP-N-acetylglucosamine 2-epimerase